MIAGKLVRSVVVASDATISIRQIHDSLRDGFAIFAEYFFGSQVYGGTPPPPPWGLKCAQHAIQSLNFDGARLIAGQTRKTYLLSPFRYIRLELRKRRQPNISSLKSDASPLQQ